MLAVSWQWRYMLQPASLLSAKAKEYNKNIHLASSQKLKMIEDDDQKWK